MLLFPNINPVALSLGPIKIHWYGLMYLLGFICARFLAIFRVKRYQLNWSLAQIDDLIFYAALGVILGGRLGYMFLYNLHALITQPLKLFMIWEGGMSFHGGLIGVMLALYFLSHKLKKSYLDILDFLAPLVPLGLAFGRIGNFING